MNNSPTVSDAKRAFYGFRTRPIQALYRSFIEEVLVEMHLLLNNSTFQYDPIFACGVMAAYNHLMESYQPETEKAAILEDLGKALNQDVALYVRDADALLASLETAKEATLLQWLTGSPDGSPDVLQQTVLAIAQRTDFKYSRLFGIGLFTLLEQVNSELLQLNFDARIEQTGLLASHLNLPADKLNKDWETYKNQLKRMEQARIVMAEGIEAERKKRAQREAERQAQQPDSNAE